MTSFPTIKIEGGLLGPDIFDQLVSGELSGQKPGDFRLTQSARINDEIAAAFADARTYWGVFQNRLNRLPHNHHSRCVDDSIFGLIGISASV